METWEIIIVVFFLFCIALILWKQVKHFQQSLLQAKKIILSKDAIINEKETELEIKETELEVKETELLIKIDKINNQQADLSNLKKEKSILEAKYLKKLKAAEVKKKNLAKYHKKKKDIRTIKQQVEDIVGKGPKWLAHSCQEAASHHIGKPIGSKGGGRKRPEKIHQIKNLYPDICPHCNTSLEMIEPRFEYSKVLTDLFREKDEMDCFDILRIKHVQQNVYRCWCPNCKCWVSPNQGLFANARFGPGFVAYVISKRIRLSLSYEEIINDMNDMFGEEFSLSVTSIINWFYKFEDQIKDVYEQLEKLVKKEAFTHIDETGLPMQGKNWWLWVICTTNLILYKQSNTRAHTAINDIINGFEGTIVADFFRAYEKFDKNDHQKCLAHLLSDIIELIVGLQKENERIERKIQKHEDSIQRKEEKALKDDEKGKKKRGRKPKSIILEPKQLKIIKVRHSANLKTLTQATDLGTFFRAPFQDTCFSWKKTPDERISVEDAQAILTGLIASIREDGVTEDTLERLLKRCEKFMPSLFTYLQHEGMPPDNNLAERDLRKFAKQRKISNDFKSVDVTKHLVEYLSLYMTCKVNGRDFNQLLQDLLSGKTVDLREFLFAVA